MPGVYVCPSGYQYYSCHKNDFQGCCAVDPCSSSECPSFFLPERKEPDTVSSGSGPPMIMTESIGFEPPPPTTMFMDTSTTKTDSGVTHTIPNNSVVTITKHTVVFSEAPSSTESSTSGDSTATASSNTCSTCSPSPTTTTSASPTPTSDGSVSSGAIAGAATGGAVILIIIMILVFLSRHRRRHRTSQGASETETLRGNLRTSGCEKLNTSHGGQENLNNDPFAPFGGRVDQPEHPHRPPSGTFEMDGTGISAVELPAISISEAPDTATIASNHEVSPRSHTATDPAATLASPVTPQEKMTYVNQWNQYRAMSSGGDDGQ